MTPEEVEDVTTAVTVGYVHSHDVSFSWHHSLLQLVTYDLTAHGRIWRGGYVSMRCGSGELVEARNSVVREFLEQGSADWLWMVDTDMGFPPDTVDRLIAAADPAARPIVGALAFSQRETAPDGAGGWRTLASPTVFDWAHDGDKRGFAVRWDYPRDTVTAVDGTGMACVLIHRSVFDRIRAAETPTPDGGTAPAGPVWFNRLPNISTGQLISEDLSFCVRARALNIPIFVHTGVRTTHHKAVWVGEETYWRERAVNPPPVAAKQKAERLAQERSRLIDAPVGMADCGCPNNTLGMAPALHICRTCGFEGGYDVHVECAGCRYIKEREASGVVTS